MKKKRRRLLYLCTFLNYPIYNLIKSGDTNSFNSRLNEMKSITGHHSTISKFYTEIDMLRHQLNMSDIEFMNLWSVTRASMIQRQSTYNKYPIREGRDNKGIYIGSGGSNRNKVRYPSKKRNKRTWTIFYKMFPYRAIQDGWDGNKSIRYNS